MQHLVRQTGRPSWTSVILIKHSSSFRGWERKNWKTGCWIKGERSSSSLVSSTDFRRSKQEEEIWWEKDGRHVEVWRIQCAGFTRICWQKMEQNNYKYVLMSVKSSEPLISSEEGGPFPQSWAAMFVWQPWRDEPKHWLFFLHHHRFLLLDLKRRISRGMHAICSITTRCH